jgi:hypothetical protein
MREIDLGSIDNFLSRFVSARHTDDLGTMVSLLPAGTSSLAGLRSTAVIRSR